MKFKPFKHLTILIIIVLFFLLIIGKDFLSTSPNKFIFVYGAIITFVLFTFGISLRYKNPSVEIRNKRLPKNIGKPLISRVLVLINKAERFIKKDKKFIFKEINVIEVN